MSVISTAQPATPTSRPSLQPTRQPSSSSDLCDRVSYTACLFCPSLPGLTVYESVKQYSCVIVAAPSAAPSSYAPVRSPEIAISLVQVLLYYTFDANLINCSANTTMLIAWQFNLFPHFFQLQSVSGVTFAEASTAVFQGLFIGYVSAALSIDRSAISIKGVMKTTTSLPSFRRKLLTDGVQILYVVVSANTNTDIVLSKMATSRSTLTTLLTGNGYTNAVALITTSAPAPTSAPTQPQPQSTHSSKLPPGSIAAAVILSIFAAAVIITVSGVYLYRQKEQNVTFTNIIGDVNLPSPQNSPRGPYVSPRMLDENQRIQIIYPA